MTKEDLLSKGFNETSPETFSTKEFWEPRIEALPKMADRLTAWTIINNIKRLRKYFATQRTKKAAP